MTISQVIQTISLGNLTYFAVSHAYFSQISSRQLRQCRRVSVSMPCSAGGALALNHFVPRKRFIRNNVSFFSRLFHLNRFIGTKSRITPENLDEHHIFAVNGNIAFTSAEVRFSTRLICSFDERNSKRSRLAKSYFCVLLKSRNEFTL